MRKLLFFLFISIFTMSLNAQSRKTQTHKKTTSSVTKKRTTSSANNLGKVWLVEGDGFFYFEGKYKGEQIFISVNFSSGSFPTIELDGTETPPTHKKTMEMSIIEDTYPVEFDDKGHLIVRDGDTIIFDGYIYEKGSRNRVDYYLVGKLNGVDVKLKEGYFN